MCDHHEQVVEEEDFPLMDAAPLSSVWIRNLEELTAANQPAVRQGQHLQQKHKHSVVFVYFLWNLSSFSGLTWLERLRSQWFFSPASFRPPSSPPPEPETRGHRWSSAPISGFFRRWRLEDLEGCPDRYRRLREDEGQI